ncbi:MAG TPA: DUF485 domain-containing protein [Abditibacterium sp.]|jgi:uncharacterized membrane protein (DUF485 family)
MNDSPRPNEIARDPEFEILVRRKNRLSTVLSLIMFGAYFGFIALLAFAPEVLSAKVGSATLGIPVGIGVIIVAWVLTGIYVRWANGAYDEMVARIKNSK